jgi:hypothetical protein
LICKLVYTSCAILIIIFYLFFKYTKNTEKIKYINNIEIILPPFYSVFLSPLCLFFLLYPLHSVPFSTLPSLSPCSLFYLALSPHITSPSILLSPVLLLSLILPFPYLTPFLPLLYCPLPPPCSLPGLTASLPYSLFYLASSHIASSHLVFPLPCSLHLVLVPTLLSPLIASLSPALSFSLLLFTLPLLRFALFHIAFSRLALFHLFPLSALLLLSLSYLSPCLASSPHFVPLLTLLSHLALPPILSPLSHCSFSSPCSLPPYLSHLVPSSCIALFSVLSLSHIVLLFSHCSPLTLLSFTLHPHLASFLTLFSLCLVPFSALLLLYPLYSFFQHTCT